MKAHINLQTRGLLVAVVPLIFQMLFIVWLIFKLFEVQTDIVKTSQSREIVSTTHLLFGDSAVKRIAAAVGDFGSSDIQPGVDSSLESRVATIENLTRSEPERALLAKKMIDQMNELLSLGHHADVEKKLGPTHWVHQEQNFYLPISIAVERFFDAANNLIGYEEMNYPFNSRAVKAIIDNVISASVGFVFASVAISAILGWFYARSIRAPLLRLEQNSELLAKREKLLPALEGKDELSSLDQFLHEVSDSLDEAFLKERELLNNAADMICALTEEGEFSSINPSGERLLGFKASELIGKSILEFVSDGDVVRADGELSAVRWSADTRIFEVQLKGSVGVPIDTRWSMRWSMSDRAIFCVAHDMTEEKNIEKLKEDFVDMVSHDLRSPLTSMLGALFFITNGTMGPMSEEISAEIAGAHRNVQRLITFVNDFLDFQKLSAGQMTIQPIKSSLREIISEAIAQVSHAAGPKGIRLQVMQADASIVCDKTKVIQVLVNLLTNAVKFTPPQGDVDVFLTGRSGATLVCVSDAGPGVPHVLREKIFEAFEQVPGESAKEGTGLGLAICKLICDAHGWSIGVEDRYESALCEGKRRGPGSLFWISIPNNPAEGMGYVEGPNSSSPA
jgi:PAS domain S-box-containing protein